MKNRKRLFGTGLILVLILTLTLIWSVTVFAAEGDMATEPAVYATIWSLLPPVVAIVLALITKGGRKIFCVYGKNSSLIRNRYV